MAAAFMAHRALFLNSILLLCIACNQQPTKTAGVFVNANNAVIKTRGGITTVNDNPFTGNLFALSNAHDTLFIRSYENGKENGEWKEFYPGGGVKEVRYFNKGRKEGKYLAFWENSSKKLEYNFSNDEYHGACREWLSNGQLVKEMNYNYGHEEGRQLAWYDNGKVRSNYTIINGRRYGLLGTKNCRNVSDSLFNMR